MLGIGFLQWLMGIFLVRYSECLSRQLKYFVVRRVVLVVLVVIVQVGEMFGAKRRLKLVDLVGYFVLLAVFAVFGFLGAGDRMVQLVGDQESKVVMWLMESCFWLLPSRIVVVWVGVGLQRYCYLEG